MKLNDFVLAFGLSLGRYGESVTATTADSGFYGFAHYNFSGSPSAPSQVGILFATFHQDAATGQTFVTVRIFDLNLNTVYFNSGFQDGGVVHIG